MDHILAHLLPLVTSSDPSSINLSVIFSGTASLRGLFIHWLYLKENTLLQVHTSPAKTTEKKMVCTTSFILLVAEQTRAIICLFLMKKISNIPITFHKWGREKREGFLPCVSCGGLLRASTDSSQEVWWIERMCWGNALKWLKGSLKSRQEAFTMQSDECHSVFTTHLLSGQRTDGCIWHGVWWEWRARRMHWGGGGSDCSPVWEM